MENKYYLNYAQKYNITTEDIDYIKKCFEHELTVGSTNIDFESLLSEVKDDASNYFNVHSSYIHINFNTTTVVTHYLKTQSNMKLLSTDIEFKPYYKLLDELGCEYIKFMNNINFYDDLESILKNNNFTHFFVSHISSSYGVLVDINKVSSICKRYNTKLIVDATQSVGNINVSNIDMKKIDLFVFTLRKWLNVSFDISMYISKNVVMDSHIRSYSALKLAKHNLGKYYNKSSNQLLNKELVSWFILNLKNIGYYAQCDNNNIIIIKNRNAHNIYDYLLNKGIITKLIDKHTLRLSFNNNISKKNYESILNCFKVCYN